MKLRSQHHQPRSVPVFSDQHSMFYWSRSRVLLTPETLLLEHYQIVHEELLTRCHTLLDHIPLYSPLYGGVYREGRVTCCLSPPTPPPIHPQNQPHRAPRMARRRALEASRSSTRGCTQGRMPASPPNAPVYRGTSLTRKRTPLGPYRGPMPRILGGS